MALTYRQVKDLYDVLKDSGVTTKSLPEWSTEMQALTGSDAYEAGQSDNWIKRASVGIDRALEKTGASDALAPIGRDFGSLFGNPEAGENVARGIPRFAANLLPMFIPGAGWGVTAARLGGMGALAGADTYTQTDSKAAGILSGLTAAAMPAVANKAEQFVLSRFLPSAAGQAGSRLVSGPMANEWGPGLTPLLERGVRATREIFPTNYGQGIAAQVGGEVAASAFGELSNMAQAAVDPNRDYHFSPSAAFIDMTLGQIPFAALYTTKGGRAALGGDTTRRHADALEHQIGITRDHLKIQEALDDAKVAPPVPDAARSVEQQVQWQAKQEEIQGELARLRGEQIRVAKDPDLGPDARAAALAPLVAADAEVSAKVEVPQRGNIFGENPDLGGHIGVVGQELPHRQGNKVRRIFIADDPSNPEEFRGKVVIYSKGTKEPTPQDVAAAPGYQTFGIPADPRWRKTLPDKVPPKDLGPEDMLAWTAAQAKLRAKVDQKAQPLEFAEQQKALDLEHWGEQMRLLDEATVELDKAATPAELTAAAAKLRLVQEGNGFPVTDDVALTKRMRALELAGIKANELAVKATRAEALRTKRQLEAAQRVENRRSEISQGEQFRADQEALRNDDSLVDEELVQLVSLEKVIQRNGGKHADQLLSGEVNRLYKEWVDGGRKVSFSVFARDTLAKASSGAGLMKLESRTNELAKQLDDSPEVQPVSDYVVETLVSVLNDPVATAKYNAWDRRAETTFTNEKAMFVALGDAHAFGPDGLDKAAEVFMEREGMDEIEARDEARDFFQRPHVREWVRALEAKLNEPRELPSPSPRSSPDSPYGTEKRQKGITAHGVAINRNQNPILGFLQGRIVRNAEGLIVGLGGRDIPTGLMQEAEFQKRTQVAPGLLPLFRQHYPEAFLGSSVDPTLLVKGLEERPLTEVMKAGAGATPGTRNRQDIKHDLENASFHVNEPSEDGPGTIKAGWGLTSQGPEGFTNFPEGSEQFAQLPERIKQLFAEYKEAKHDSGLTYSGHYSISTNPRGGTEIAVVAKKPAPNKAFVDEQGNPLVWSDLPSDAHHDVPGLLGTATVEEKTLGELRATMGADHPKLKRFEGKGDEVVIGVQTEAQSDWEGEVRKFSEENLEQRDGRWYVKQALGTHFDDTIAKKGFDNKEKALQFLAVTNENIRDVSPHPLLPYWERLVADAVIQHGLERGWEGVVVTDAKTAAMTEGHDQVGSAQERLPFVAENTTTGEVKYFDTEEKAQKYADQLTLQSTKGQKWEAKKNNLTISQFPGHAQHYGDPDFRIGVAETPGSLQQEFAKATGEENTLRKGGGNVLAVGVHKGADTGTRKQVYQQDGQWYVSGDDATTYPSKQAAQESQVSGSPSLTEPHPVTGVVGPKVFATGNFYSFDRLKRAYAADPTLSRKEAANASRTPGKPFVPKLADDFRIVADLQPEKGGIGLWGWLARQDEPSSRAFAEDTKRYRNSISRIDVQVRQGMDTEGSAQLMPNGRVRILLHERLFWGDADPRARQVVAHEFIHGLTLLELEHNPTAVAELDAMRGRLVSGLDADMRKQYEDAVASRWMDRHASGDKNLPKLGRNWREHNILYGLLNHKELLSQGMTSPEFIEYLRSQKSEGGKTFFHTFLEFVKRTLGLGQQGRTAFDELMSRTATIMQHGEHVAGFQNYAERFFEGRGMEPEVAQMHTDRALGLIFGESYGTTPELLFRSLDMRNVVKSNEVINSEKMLELLLRNKATPEYLAFEQSMRGDHGLKPDRNGLDELTHRLLNGEEQLDAFDTLPPEATAYIWAKVNDMKAALDVVAAATKEKVSPLLNITEPGNLRQPVRDAVRAAQRLLKAQAFQEESARELIGLQGIDPMGYVEAMVETEGVASMSPKSEMMGYVEDIKAGVKAAGNFVKDGLQPIAQRMAQMPETAEVYARGFQMAENSRRFASDTLKPMGMDISNPSASGEVTKESLAESLKVLANPRLEAIAQKYIWLNQVEGKKNKSTTILPESHPEIQKIMAGLSPADKSAIHDVIGKLSYSTQATNAKQLEYMRQVAAVRAAIIVNADNGLTTAQNVKVTGEMLQSVLDLNDPAKAAIAGQKLQALQSKFTDPQAYIEALKFTEAEAAKYKLWEDLFKANPAYANAQRQGRYLIHYFDKSGKLLLGQAMTKASGRRWLESRGFKLKNFENNWKDGEDAFPANALGAEDLQKYHEYEETQLQILRNRGFTEEQVQKVRDSRPSVPLAAEAAYRGGISNDVALARDLGKGAEHLPWVENHFTWVQRSANYWTRQLFAAQMDAHILEKQFEDRADLRQDFKTHKDNMLQRDPEIAQKITRFARTWFMGFNAASALINMAQPFTTHVAELTALTGKPLDSYRRILNALREIAGERGGKDWATPEHKWLHGEMAKDGILDLSMYDDNAAAQESIHTRYKEVIEGSQPQTLGQKLAKAAGHYSTAAFWMFRQGERINATAATFASYDLFREQGLSREEAYAKAKEFNARTNYSGGKAQRSLGAFSSRSGFGRGTAMLATSLQSYVLGTTFQLARYLQAGLFRPKGLTPAEVFAARKAAVQMLGTQLAAAGVLGLPFVSGAIALLDKMFPGLELNRNLRELMGQIFGEDEKTGNTLSDMAMTGLPSMLGWDMQSRMSMGNTVPGVSEINGFQPEMLLGPSANLVTNFIRGGKGLVTGDMGAAAKGLLPGYAKSLIEAGKQTLGQPVQDSKDRPLFTPTPGEILGQSIGFKPKRLSDSNAADRMLRASEDVAQRRDHQQSNQLAERALAGEFGTVRQTLIARGQSEQGFDPVAGARQVAQAAEALTFPRDLRREGTQRLSAQRSKMLSSFGVKAGDVSEVARLQFRWQIEARLGVPPTAGRNAELQQATLMDQLAAKNPGLSRLELRQLALQIRRPNSVAPTLGEPRELQ